MSAANRTFELPADVRSAAILWHRRPGAHPSLIIFVLLAALIIGGCSTRFFYNQLDWLIVGKIEDYVSLRKEQKAELKTRLNEQLEFIRTNEIPRAAVILQQAMQEIDSGFVKPQMIDQQYQDMLALMDAVMLGIVPLSEWFLLSLNDAQIQELFENFEELNSEMYDDYSGRTEAERSKNRNKSAIKMIERFTGRLRDDQKFLITNSLAQMEDSSEQWIDYQREWQRRFRELLESPPPSEEFRAELTRLFVYPRSFHTAEYRAAVDANRARLNEMLAELLTGLSDRQRKRTVEKLGDYAEILTKLSQSP